MGEDTTPSTGSSGMLGIQVAVGDVIDLWHGLLVSCGTWVLRGGVGAQCAAACGSSLSSSWFAELQLGSEWPGTLAGSTHQQAVEGGSERMLQMSIQSKCRFLKATLHSESITIRFSCGQTGEGNIPWNLSQVLLLISVTSICLPFSYMIKTKKISIHLQAAEVWQNPDSFGSAPIVLYLPFWKSQQPVPRCSINFPGVQQSQAVGISLPTDMPLTVKEEQWTPN